MNRPGRRPSRTVPPVALAAVLALVAAVVAFVLTRAAAGSPSGAAPATPHPLPRAIAQLTEPPAVDSSGPVSGGPSSSARSGGTSGGSAVPQPAAVAAALKSALTAPALGGQLLAHVVDAATGRVLFDSSGATPAPPASTGKLLTAAAVLATHAPTARFVTRVVQGPGGSIVVIGGGDPTLTAARPGVTPPYPGAARLSDLAAQLRRAGVHPSSIVVDDSLYSGPSVAPSWDRSDMGTSYGAPITALMVDGGRATPDAYGRSLSPDLAAGRQLARALGTPGLPVRRGTAPAGARQLASVQSAPLLTIVTECLQESDNVLADTLARQVAVAVHQPASFTGAVTAIRTVLARLGVNVGTGMKDGSGLSSADRVSPVALTGVLRLIAGELGGRRAGAVSDVVAALPVGGWSGTLEYRYVDGPAAAAAGRVRAKTGTLSGVASLAGLAYDRSGRLLVFSFDADRAVSTYDADRAMDVLAARLVACGCAGS